jgi:FkbM family methyltransferase
MTSGAASALPRTRPPGLWRLARALLRLPRFKGRDRLLILLRPYLHPPLEPLTFALSGGLLVRGDLGDEIDAQLYLYGIYEPIVSGLVRQLLGPGDVVVDVGANIGYFSLLAAGMVGASGSVHAFEANPATYRRLTANIELNGFTNVRANPAALGADRAPMALLQSTVHRSGDVIAAVVPAGGPGATLVPQVPLDDYCESEGVVPSLIKMDVNGGEELVFRGSERVLSRHRPVLLAEYHPAWAVKYFGGDSSDMMPDLMRRFDYRFYWIAASGLVPYEDAKALKCFDDSMESFLGLHADQADATVERLSRRYPRVPRTYCALELWPDH